MEPEGRVLPSLPCFLKWLENSYLPIRQKGERKEDHMEGAGSVKGISEEKLQWANSVT